MPRLLFDQNLSPRLVEKLNVSYPGSTHVSTVGLATALDRAVWEYARENDYVMVTRDVDFTELGLLLGFPPKVIWIRRGNCSTEEIERLLRDNRDALQGLANDAATGVLALY